MLPKPNPSERVPFIDACDTPEDTVRYIKWLFSKNTNLSELSPEDMKNLTEKLGAILNEGGTEEEFEGKEKVDKRFLDSIVQSFSSRVIGVMQIRGEQGMAKAILRGKAWAYAELHRRGMHAYTKPEHHDVIPLDELHDHIKANLDQEFVHGPFWLSQIYYYTGIRQRDSLNPWDIRKLREIAKTLAKHEFEKPNSNLNPIKSIMAIEVVCDFLEKREQEKEQASMETSFEAEA